MSASASRPLPGLLSRVLVDLGRTFERSAPAAGPEPSIVLWSNVLRLFEGDHPVRRADLPRLARLSTRAMKATVDQLVRLGWLSTAADPQRSRSTLVHLEPPARHARDTWEPLVAVAEAAWRGRFAARGDALRAPLARLVSLLDVELAHYPTGYGTVDVSMAGRAWGWAGEHGADWRPVARGPGDTASTLALPALLSQALIAFAVDYERECEGPMAYAADALQAVGEAGTPAAALPAIVGPDLATLERHGVVTVDGGGRKPDRPVRLTAKGRRWRDAYPRLVARVEADWRRRFGAEVVDTLRDALEAVDADLDPALPHFPVVRFVPGLGFCELAGRSSRLR